MDNYIIDPMWFYWISTISSIKIIQLCGWIKTLPYAEFIVVNGE